MKIFDIGEIADRSGIPPSTLRYYEDRGLVTPQRRAGKRMYAREQLRRLAFIQLMQRLGIRLDAALSFPARIKQTFSNWSVGASVQHEIVPRL